MYCCYVCSFACIWLIVAITRREDNRAETEHWISNPRDNSFNDKSQKNFTLSRMAQEKQGSLRLNNKQNSFTGGFTSFFSLKRKEGTEEKGEGEEMTQMRVVQDSNLEACETASPTGDSGDISAPTTESSNYGNSEISNSIGEQPTYT